MDAFLDAFEYLGGILAFAHQHDSRDHVVGVVLTHDALYGHVADRDVRNVSDKHRRAIVGRDHDVLYFIGGLEQADAADQILLRALGDFAAADVAIGTA